MMRSMFSGVSSLRNHQVRMDVIGNNIANVNTVGYKADRVTFQELFQQTIRGASAPSGNRGGVNPMQVGLGVKIGSIDTLHTETSLETTGLMTDLAIEGNGFFIVNDGERSFYTRAGLFDIDEEGNFVMRGNGLYVQGWTDVPGSGEAGRINLYTQLTVPPKASENFWLGGNLDAAQPAVGDPGSWDGGNPPTPATTLVGIVRDSQGGAHQVEIRFWKTEADTNRWHWQAWAEGERVGLGNIRFDHSGAIYPDTATGNMILEPVGVDPINVTLDFSRMTQYAQQTSAEVIGHDGLVAGSLETFTIDGAGIIRGVYSNGLTRDLGQIALAYFANPGGLAKMGDTLFDVTANSGEAQIGRAGEGGRGTIAPGSLEMSNVDLSQEFTNMITTQRGFQAASRIITTSDEMLQELVNLKR